MEKQFQYIIDLAKKYQSFYDNTDILLKELNNLNKKDIKEVLDSYGNPERNFYPVIFLRTEIARKLLKGEIISTNTIETIKTNIRERNIHAFQHMSLDFREKITNYPERVGDMFQAWSNYWKVLHIFFYKGETKILTQKYLEDIAIDIKNKLELNDYTYHTVDFQGASNFGSTMAWLALYPNNKDSHRDSIQFFVGFRANPDAGLIKGHNSDIGTQDKLTNISNYNEIYPIFKNLKAEIIKLNEQIRNYYKYSPGRQAIMWDEFYKKEIIAIYYKDTDKDITIGNLNKFKTLEELNKSVGLKPNSQSNTTWNLWLFKNAKKGDVIFINKGVKTCLGIGIITGDYKYVENPNGYNHVRKVKWITNKVYNYIPNTLKYDENSNYKTLFRPDTFSPTLAWEFILNQYIHLFPELDKVFKNNHLYFNPTIIDPPEPEIPKNFWWLNANPKIWSISNISENDLQTYTTHNERGNKRRIYKYFEEVQPNDYVIAYESSPSKQIKGICQITKGIHTTEEGECIEFKMLEKLDIPLHWHDIKNIQELSNCEVFINNQGSLFKLTEDEYDVISQVIDDKNTTEPVIPSGKYSFVQDEDKPFITESDFMKITKLLRRKKNIILQGPPGVGKTFLARKIAYQIMEEVNDANIEMVQFHQSFSYEDFVQGLRPTQKGYFDLKNGIFYSFCQKALAHPKRKFFFIIDEINRGNLSKIFGELMMLIEADKRNKKHALKLTYAEDEDDKFYVPDNFYIIGTMNTADRSLAIVDYALRRRFAFITLKPNFDDKFIDFLKQKGMSNNLIQHILTNISIINNEIKKDPNLGTGFQIGHSYFCTYDNNIYSDEKDWFNEIANYEIKPLIEEIWFDDNNIIEDLLSKLEF